MGKHRKKAMKIINSFIFLFKSYLLVYKGLNQKGIWVVGFEACLISPYLFYKKGSYQNHALLATHFKKNGYDFLFLLFFNSENVIPRSGVLKLLKKQARRTAKAFKYLANNKLPWKIAVLIDSAIQKRSIRHTDNAQ
jgi:hypothetical protein